MNIHEWLHKLLDANPIEQVRVLILFFTMMILSMQLWRMLRENKKNHSLTKKQMTIQYLKDIRSDYRCAIEELEATYPNETKIPKDIENVEDKKRVDKVLSIVEHLCVPINDDIYDLDVLKKMSNRFFKNLYKKYEDYIKESRIRDNNKFKYVEFEKLYKKLD